MVVVFRRCTGTAPLTRNCTGIVAVLLLDDDVGCLCAQMDAVMYTAQYQPKEFIGKASPQLDWFALGKTIEATVRC